MTIPVFGLSAIKDKAIRDAIFQLAQRAGIGSGDGVAVEVQTDDPVSEPGETGDIIYATGSESIWIFVETSWERASSATSGITVLINAYREDVNPVWGSLSGVVQTSPNFKNDTAQRIGLAVLIFEGGVEVENDIYYGPDTTYTWTKNGVAFTPNESQETGTGVDQRVVLINEMDVAEGNINEVFTCIIDY